MRVILALLFGLTVAVNLQIWVYDSGQPAIWRLNQAIAAQRAENTELFERNRRLAAEVNDLQSGMAAVDELARRELGMVSSDETFFLYTNSAVSKTAQQ